VYSDITDVFVAADDIRFQSNSKDYFSGDEASLLFGGKKLLPREKIKLSVEYKINKIFKIESFESELKKELVSHGLRDSVKIKFINHHTCHMSSVYFTSKNLSSKRGYVFCIDGYGDGLSITSYRYTEEDLMPVLLNSLPSSKSPGAFYSSVTRYLGLKPNRHEGKVTGLAAYGDPNVLYQKTDQLLSYTRDTGFNVFKNKNPVRNGLIKLWSLVTNKHYKSQYDRCMEDIFNGATKEDVAAAAQKKLDNVIVSYISDVIRHDDFDSILLAGGVFANVHTNMMISRHYPGKRIYVHPGMSDEGVSLGAVLYGCSSASNDYNKISLNHVYFGSNYDDSIDRFIGNLSSEIVVDNLSKASIAPSSKVAQLIEQGAVVGLFQGRMEYGPRSLGNRSIIVDPRDALVNDKVNNRLNRTEYMPFAPVVLREYASTIFDITEDNSYACEFMTIVTQVKKDWSEKIAAVVHVDNTARPQIIDRKVNEIYYDIVHEFYKITGIPVLVNTSFNVHEEPIVESPEDAVRALKMKAVDYVYMPPFLLSLK